MIPTAEEFLETDKDWNRTTAQMMIEFAKLHVEAALEEANRKVIVTYYYDEGGIRVNKDSILNSYPLENIK